jgi:Cd2+/Zn2+-exporting ATPase/Cu+-exporting ATPase
MASVAVLVVACSCAFALAAPVALLASIGAAARQGLLIKGGKYLEALARADVLLIDKTGTLTLGRPQITDVVSLNGVGEDEVVRLAASAEWYSEHPLAEAVRQASEARGLVLEQPTAFRAVPGRGVHARIGARAVVVGNRQIVADAIPEGTTEPLTEAGKSLLYVEVDGALVGVLAAADTERADVREALALLPEVGIHHTELLTGDHEKAAMALATRLGLRYRADLLPEDKIAVVKAYQAEGHTVMMIGDGVNDAPALAQADIGIAMGAAGSDVAIDAAHVVLMREDWMLVPQLVRIARRTMRVVQGNIGFTAVYNAAGLTLAALGLLPPILAAALHALPDVVILGNASRLLRTRRKK